MSSRRRSSLVAVHADKQRGEQEGSVPLSGMLLLLVVLAGIAGIWISEFIVDDDDDLSSNGLYRTKPELKPSSRKLQQFVGAEATSLKDCHCDQVVSDALHYYAEKHIHDASPKEETPKQSATIAKEKKPEKVEKPAKAEESAKTEKAAKSKDHDRLQPPPAIKQHISKREVHETASPVKKTAPPTKTSQPSVAAKPQKPAAQPALPAPKKQQKTSAPKVAVIIETEEETEEAQIGSEESHTSVAEDSRLDESALSVDADETPEESEELAALATSKADEGSDEVAASTEEEDESVEKEEEPETEEGDGEETAGSYEPALSAETDSTELYEAMHTVEEDDDEEADDSQEAATDEVGDVGGSDVVSAEGTYETHAGSIGQKGESEELTQEVDESETVVDEEEDEEEEEDIQSVSEEESATQASAEASGKDEEDVSGYSQEYEEVSEEFTVDADDATVEDEQNSEEGDVVSDEEAETIEDASEETGLTEEVPEKYLGATEESEEGRTVEKSQEVDSAEEATEEEATQEYDEDASDDEQDATYEDETMEVRSDEYGSEEQEDEGSDEATIQEVYEQVEESEEYEELSGSEEPGDSETGEVTQEEYEEVVSDEGTVEYTKESEEYETVIEEEEDEEEYGYEQEDSEADYEGEEGEEYEAVTDEYEEVYETEEIVPQKAAKPTKARSVSTKEAPIPLATLKGVRSRRHIADVLGFAEIGSEADLLEEKLIAQILKDIKKSATDSIKPLEKSFKFSDISQRILGDAEIFNKPMALFLGPWSSGKSTMINYLLGIDNTRAALKTGPQPTDSFFTIIHHSEDGVVRESGLKMAGDWAFSGVNKFGQAFLSHFRGLGLNHPLLQKVTLVDTPGILDGRRFKDFPLDDVFQWFIDRADAIYVVFDPSKLEIGADMKALLDQLRGKEQQTRFLLNKADLVEASEVMRVAGQLLWNVSPLLGSTDAPIIFAVSMINRPYLPGTPGDYFADQEEDFLRHLKEVMDDRVENTVLFARRHAVRVRNHAKLVDCYLDAFYKHKGFFGNKKRVADQVIKNPSKYGIFDAVSQSQNVSRYDLLEPEDYESFFKLHPLYDFSRLKDLCGYVKGCPLDKLDRVIAYELPRLLTKYLEKSGVLRDPENSHSDMSKASSKVPTKSKTSKTKTK